MLYLYFKNLVFQAKYFLEFFRIKYEEELAWIMEAVKERRDKCPKMIMYVNSITMCEMLYIWFHSELKKDAYIDEMTIENRMVELYHAHTDEDTKLSRHIYSNTLGITTFSTTNVAEMDDLVLLSIMDMQEVCQCHVTSVAKKGNTTANAMTVNT